MSDGMRSAEFRDEELVAFLDGELDDVRAAALERALEADEALCQRLDAFTVDIPALKLGADDILQHAPSLNELMRADGAAAEASVSVYRKVPIQLVAESAGTADAPEGFSVASGHSGMRSGEDDGFKVSGPAPSIPLPANQNRRRWMQVAASMMVAACLAGLGGYEIGKNAEPDWRMDVANYQALYVTETLDHVEVDLAALEDERDRVVGELGIDISLDALTAPQEAQYKRGQVLGFGGKPLAQFAYLTADGQPIAFCVTRSGEADSPIETSKMRGLAAANWSKDGVGYILIGTQDEKLIEQMARTLANKV